MKNLFIINEEEKKRILNIHESASKRHYLNEQGPPKQEDYSNYYKMAAPATTVLNALPNQFALTTPQNAGNVAPIKDKTEVKKAPDTVQKQKTQANPIVTQIQNKLIELGYKNYLGSTGADGILGANTLKGILTALGTSENLNKMDNMVPKQITSITEPSSQPSAELKQTTQGQPADTTPKETLAQQKDAPNIDNNIE